jgi:hypothetical protein
VGATDVAINITSNGAGEARAGLDSLSAGMAEIGQQHNDLAEKFSHRFEHIGLKLFAGELLQVSGLGGEARMIISTLMLTINSAGAAFGSAVGPIMLVVSAFAAVAGIIQKVSQHHKDLSEQLEKTNKATHDQLEKTNATLASIEAYRNVVGNIPPELDRWEAAERALQRAQVERQIAGDQVQLASLKSLVTQEEIHKGQLKNQIADQEDLMKSLKSMGADQAVLIAQAAQLKKLEEAYKAGAMGAVEHKAKVAELVAEIALLGSKGTDDLKKLTEGIKQSEEEANKETKEFQKMAEEHVKAIQKQADAETERYHQWAKNREEMLKKTHDTNTSQIEMEENLRNRQLAIDVKYYDDVHKAGMQVISSIGNAFGQSVAKMIVEGKSFTDSFQAAVKQMAEQVIADIIRIKIEWLILQSMTGGAGGMLGGIIPRAAGGSMLVTKPTMFLAGENGEPEVATFTPLSKMGGGAKLPAAGAVGGGGTTISIGQVETHVHGVSNPDQIADEVGRSIINRIRGMGELNFTRGF